MKLAIIGSGISGLTAAYQLQAEHEFVLYEAAERVGGHTNTVDVEIDGERQAIDTGFIVFNDWTYPNFIQLLTELKVASQPSTMSFSVRDDGADLEYNGHSVTTLFAQRRNLLRPRFYRMLLDILRFNRDAVRLVDAAPLDCTVGDFLQQHRFSQAFSEHYLLPMGAAIWSCPTGVFASFPIRFIVEFYRNHGLLSVTNRPIWRVIAGGSKNYVEPMIRGFRDRIRLNSPICRVTRGANHVEVETAGGDVETFDHVIFACHSDQALRILGTDATAAEREILSEFPYGRNLAVLHTDITTLPTRRGAWASWNYRIHPDRAGAATVTYNMNMLQGIRSRHTFCVTLNEEASIDPSKILGRYEYHHPIFTVRRAAAQARHSELLNHHRTSFCGAYWGNGFHEDGVNSALAVVRAISSRPESIRRPVSLQGAI